ncbi:unnamed protein product [Tilletia laevis]|uniref:Uncharacterized protein n=1 Tax=Tilletia laevis TaxID=157183 RepID=A0A9N8M8Z1_9BASI|nr:unnamed protein product [Tilletia laevis]CAD6959926.1 unnamed protein product [Tilletia laevis]CAD6979389.1 unnamed protein product [Tilletia controversa]
MKLFLCLVLSAALTAQARVIKYYYWNGFDCRPCLGLTWRTNPRCPYQCGGPPQAASETAIFGEEADLLPVNLDNRIQERL